MILQPKSKSSEIISGLVQLDWNDRQNQILLRRYQKEIERSLSNDPCAKFIALGIIAAMERNLDGVHECFKKAINLSCGNSAAICNYTIALGHLGFYSEATQKIQQACEQDPSDLNILDALIFHQTYSGRIHDAYASARKWFGLQSTHHNLSYYLSQANQVLTQENINDDAIEQLYKIAITPLRKRNLYIGAAHFIAKFDMKNSWVQYDLVPDMQGDEFAEIEDELDEILTNYSSEIVDVIEIQYTEPVLNDFIEKIRFSDEGLSSSDVLPIDESQIRRIGKLVGEL